MKEHLVNIRYVDNMIGECREMGAFVITGITASSAINVPLD